MSVPDSETVLFVTRNGMGDAGTIVAPTEADQHLLQASG